MEGSRTEPEFGSEVAEPTDQCGAWEFSRRQFMKRIALAGVGVASATSLLAACGGDDERRPMTGTEGNDPSHAAGPDWGYESHNGPAQWGTLDDHFEVCDIGGQQSPIDLTDAQSHAFAPVEFNYGLTKVAIENNGHTIQVNPDPGNGIVVENQAYELAQFHFHHPSEHTVDGVQYPLEMHLVHSTTQGALAVVGVLLAEGDTNEALRPIWATLPQEPASPKPLPDEVDLPALLPAERTTWRYPGSLTTPPCTEGVSWIVMTQEMTMSTDQITEFGSIHPNNYRPVQPLGERVLYRG